MCQHSLQMYLQTVLCLQGKLHVLLPCEWVSELAVALKLAVFPRLPLLPSLLSLLLAVSADFSELVDAAGP